MIEASSKPKPRKSLAETHPELAAQAEGWYPTLVWAGSYKKMNSKCVSEHKWEASIANLRFANFRAASLAYANFRGANLDGADLIAGTLGEAYFINPDLSNASLNGTNLIETNFKCANLIGADLDDAVFDRTVMPNGEIRP